MTTDQKPAKPAAPATNRPDLRFTVVGIGASAGGLQALKVFFAQMPADCDMAFVVIMHLSAQHKSALDQILQAVTPMPVIQVSEKVRIERNHVYLISPGSDLCMLDGELRLVAPSRTLGPHVAIDQFFRTLAKAHETHAIGVLLSGAGSDGSVGIASIKEAGGVTLAQLPEDAEYDSMPRHAIETGMVDIVLPVGQMPDKLMALTSNIAKLQAMQPAGAEAPVLAPEGMDERRALHEILALLRSRSGHDFHQYKGATVRRRIERRLQVNAISNLDSYLAYLRATPEETKLLLKDMLISVTNFFRDREAFEKLAQEVFPVFFDKERLNHNERELRVWSAACATGEEVYSLAMLLLERMEQEKNQIDLQLFATDIDEHALNIGRRGIYPVGIITDISDERVKQHFIPGEGVYQVRKEVRERVLFAKHNLLTDPPFSKLDLISCRNLLIYLDREAQSALLQTFHFALKPDGYLFLGNSESADVCASLFIPVDKKNRIYRRKNVSRTLRSPMQLVETPMPVLTAPLALPQNSKKISYADIHQRVLEQYAPPSVILDPGGNIVHSSERAGRFLRHVAGEPTQDILMLIQPDLRLALRTAIFQANQSGKSVEARRVRLRRDGRDFFINMIVRPFSEGAANVDYLLVLFDEVEAVMSIPEGAGDEVKDSVLTQLEAELQRTKDQLQFTVEHYDTSTEELKASNEELQAINEELRSATEELETSKEELQSINEELITVNAELKAKIEETGKINDDLQNLIVSTDIATLFVDRNMRIKWFTPQATRVFNIIANDAGRSLLDITHKLEYPELTTDTRRVFESLRQIEREVFSQDKHWYLVRLLPYRTGDDRIEGAVMTFIDITGRMQAEEQLRAGEAHMALVAQSTRDYAIVTTDTEGMITTWSRGAETIFGHSEKEALGQPLAFIYTEADRQSQQLAAQLDLAKKRGYAIDQRWHERKGGKLIFCSGVINPLSDPQLRGFAYIARDTTRDQERFEKQRARLKHTQASNQLKDEFFAVMSHELKHPLNLIQLNAELLSRIPETRSSNPAERATQAILRAVRSQAQIIDDLLDISRITTGKLKLDTTRVEFKHLLLEIIEVLKPMAVAAGVGIEIKELPETDVWLQADPIRLEQIVWNLLNNALKFTPEGKGVQVHMTAEGELIRLDIIDQGQGIDPAAIARIFDMFGQAAMHHATRSRHGLGIGLALVKQLVQAHHGRIEAASDGLGKGAQFSVWLPHGGNAGASSVPARPTQEGLLDSVKVLLVDDSHDVLEMMQLLLEAEDAIVTSTSVSSDGLALARSEVFDLMLLDIGMPDMDGHQLMREIRKDSLNQKTPAIALTGYGRVEDVTRAAESGFDRHLSKPISLDALIDTSLKLIQEKKA